MAWLNKGEMLMIKKPKDVSQNRKGINQNLPRTWSNGSIIKGSKQIDSLNFSLHYSSPNAWEGIRSYKQQDGTTKIWELEAHIERFFDKDSW